MLVATVEEAEEGERAAVLLAAVVEEGPGGLAVLFAAVEREDGGPAVPLAAVDVGEPRWWVEAAVDEG